MGQASSDMMDGSSFEGKWNVIGAGGGGQVFKARHRRWKKDVAVKILGVDNGLKDEELAREARLMYCVDSPYVLKFLGVFRGLRPGCHEILVGLVMDLMERGSLNSLQKKRERHPLPWPLVFRLVHQVAEGMNHLHSLEPALILKDLKPDNLLLDSDLNVKITDFGIAKFADTVTAAPIKGVKTQFFAPPEAFLPEEEIPQSGATCAFDVYSYAITVWTILNPAYIIAKNAVSYKKRPSLEDVNRMEVPGLEELVKLMVSCWHEDPKKRPTFAECTAVTGHLYEEKKRWINFYVHQVQLELDGAQLGFAMLKDPERDFKRLTLDTNTTNYQLSLSENNRKVTCVEQEGPYPSHDDRFDELPQVLCTESLTGRCYWEVEWKRWVEIAVTYRGIGRKGKSKESLLGKNDKSWSLGCGDVGFNGCNSYKTIAIEEAKQKRLSVSPSEGSRVAVYLDCPAGTLSFYEVSSEGTLTHHLYTFKTTSTESTEPLYAGFYLWRYFDFGTPTSGDYSSSVRLCEQI